MEAMHATVPLWSVIPFVLILLSIALFPLFAPQFWHRHYPKVALVFAVGMSAYVLMVDVHWWTHTALEYVSFIALLGALYVISGGIYVSGKLEGTPAVNARILITGGILASFIGTTGASMLLIRTLLRANEDRPHPEIPVIFFVFVVSNMGGMLTPLGDPPLFLGFLKGVPFFWTLKLFPQWLVGSALVLLAYGVVDTLLLRRAGYKPTTVTRPFRPAICGGINFVFLGGVVGVVIIYGQLPQTLGLIRDGFQVVGLGFLAWLSIRFSPERARKRNYFTYAPIKEVAILFAAIFACMIPAVKLLEFRGGELGIDQPWQFFWMTGLLSSFLDNAPTYVTFLSLGKTLPSVPPLVHLAGGEGVIQEVVLKAISVGAVFMGALTYIGNGPNFMVKAIAEEKGVPMPSFLGYLKYSVLVLLPIMLVVCWVFF